MGQRDFQQQDATTAFLPTLVPWGYDQNISVALGALAGNEASSDPRQAKALPTLWRKERGWKGSQWIPKKKPHSRRPWEAQVASVVGLFLSSSSVFLFSPCSKNLLKSAGYGEATHKGRLDGGQDFYRAALSQLAWPRPGPKCTHHLANSPHQQKDNRKTAVIRFNGWLWWIGRSKWSQGTLMEELRLAEVQRQTNTQAWNN